MSKSACAIIFLAGGAAGAVLSYFFVKKKCEEQRDEEIQSVKEYYRRKYGEQEKSENTQTADISVDKNEGGSFESRYVGGDTQEYNNVAQKYNTENKEFQNAPFVIHPDRFGEDNEYETITLTRYSDGVVADENDEPLDDFEDVIGTDWENRFGEYDEPDAVYVRNDILKADYEILRDNRKYSDSPRPKIL